MVSLTKAESLISDLYKYTFISDILSSFEAIPSLLLSNHTTPLILYLFVVLTKAVWVAILFLVGSSIDFIISFLSVSLSLIINSSELFSVVSS